MTVTTARVPTANGAKYLTQLCKHWSHKLDVQLEGPHGVVRFGTGVATMDAEADALVVRLEGAEAAEVERLKGVVASHLDRFAFREAPLPFNWA